MNKIKTVIYEDGKLVILNQAKLPLKEEYVELKTKEDVREAISRLMVRGAPAIGVVAAYGLYCAMRDENGEESEAGAMSGDIGLDRLREIKKYLVSARPTAVNLKWALDRMENRFISDRSVSALKDEADKIKSEDEKACRAMAEEGLKLLRPGMGILTHCNAGALATTGTGTCLAPVYLGNERGYGFKVFADETRPLLQGARLTSWELMRAGVDTTLICDNMAADVMRKGLIDAVVVGCDRMAANGDGANKIGTSGLAVLAKNYDIPFYIFVPTSTIDMKTRSGDDIPIEERAGEEIHSMWFESRIAPEGIKIYNPAFDITPGEFITAVITEKGTFAPEDLSAVFEQQ